MTTANDRARQRFLSRVFAASRRRPNADRRRRENETEAASPEKFSEFYAAAANLPNYFEFNFPYRDFQRLTIGGQVLFVSSRREQA